jgi:aldehyde:ferredoxin oxidoreductase
VGLLYAVGNAGAKHLEAEHDTAFERKNAIPELGIIEPINRLYLKGQVRRIVVTQELWSLVDSLILCKFLAPIRAISMQEMVEMMNLATGHQYSIQELLRVGERAINIGRAFNVREGFGRKDDYVPHRLYEPLEGGASAGAVFTKEEFEEGLNNYYRLRGWDIDTGIPTKDRLLDLGLRDVAENLAKHGFYR